MEVRDVKVRDDDYEVRDYKEDHNDFNTNSSLFKIYFLIKNYLKVNYKDLLFPSFTPYFFRFLEENVLKDLFYLTFTFMDLEDFKNKFTKMKNKEKVIEEYFKFLEKSEVKECKVEEGDKVGDGVNDKDIIHLNSSLIYDLEDFTLKGISEVGESLNYGESRDEGGFKGKDSRSTLNPALNHPTTINPTTLPYNTKDHIYSFSLILKSKFLKDNLVFRSLKSFIEKNLENLYDTVCIHFVSHLNSNECIILDSKLKTKCKFKNLLGKKCKDPKIGSEGSTTYI